MGLHHRKLMPEICESICHVEQNCSSDCKVCLKFCLTNPQYYYYSPPPSQPPPPQGPSWYLDDEGHQGKNHTLSIYLVLAISLLAAAFFAVCCCAICTRFFSRRRRVSLSSNQQTQETRDDFLDEEHGPVVDHPIWYIRTPGLQESIINAITICRYKKGEGLIEGTECSVCLSVFIEDESLRLLPKCNHAFHLPCIDTWLRSHTNCPMCRAPIVTNPARIPSMEPNFLDSSSISSSSSSSLEHTQMELVENSGERIGGMENSASELRNRAEEQGQLEVEDGTRVTQSGSLVAEVVSIRPRRSVSLDSSSGASINLALASVVSLESDFDSNRVLGDVNGQIASKRVTGNENLPTTSKGRSSSFRIRYLHSVPSSMKRSRSYNGKHLLSWYSRSQTQKKPNAPLRSF